jgi:hypothetical protein
MVLSCGPAVLRFLPMYLIVKNKGQNTLYHCYNGTVHGMRGKQFEVEVQFKRLVLTFSVQFC